MKNESILWFVKMMELVAEFFGIILILDTRYSIVNNNEHFINNSIMRFIIVFIIATFFLKIIFRSFFKEKPLKEGEIDKVSKGIFWVILIWGLILFVLYICINVPLFASIRIGSATLGNILK